jgi:hypothetical protein
MATIKDHTGLIPFILFALLGGIVIYAIIKGSPKKMSAEEQSKLFGDNAGL